MFLFAQSFKRPQRLNLKEPGSFVVMWIPQFWRCFCQRKLEKVHFSGKFRSVQLPSLGVFRLLSPFSGYTSKCLIRIYILYASVFIFKHNIHIIYLHMLELKRAKILSLRDVCGWKGISVGSPSVVTMSSFQKCWKVSKVPVLANSSLVNMKGLMFVLWYPTFAKFGKKIWRPIWPISTAPAFLLQFVGRQNNCFGQLVTAWNRLGEAESWLRQSMVGWDEICAQCCFELVELQIIFCWILLVQWNADYR